MNFWCSELQRRSRILSVSKSLPQRDTGERPSRRFGAGQEISAARFKAQLGMLEGLARSAGEGPAFEALSQLLASARAPSTWASYASFARAIEDWCKEKGFAVDCPSFCLFLAAKSAKWSPGTMASCASAFEYVYGKRLAKDEVWKDLAHEVIEGKKRIVPKARQVAASEEEMKLLLDNLSREDHEWPMNRRLRMARLICLLFSGLLRVSEAVELTWDDILVASDSLRVTIRKAKRDQYSEGRSVAVALGPRVAHLWRDKGAGDSKVLSSTNGSPWSAGAAASELGKASQIAGLRRVAPHELRRGGATVAIAGGAPAALVQENGRWKSAESMIPYIRPDWKQLAKASFPL